MPDAGGRPDDQQVEHHPAPARPAAPQGEVQVLPEPAAQGDVPPPPELAGRLGDIGIVEVFQKLEAQHPPQADGHVRVAGEVEVELEGEGGDAQPGPQGGEPGPGRGQIHVPQRAQGVGKQNLFTRAHGEALDAGGELLKGVIPPLQLVVQVLVLDDGPGDELGEQGDEGAEGDDVLLAPGVPPVHVDGVAHGLEGVEGDADGQGKGDGAAGQGEAVDDGQEAQAHRRQAAGDEVIILEEAQQQKVEHHRRGHRQPGPPVIAFGFTPGDDPPVGVVDGDGQEHDEHIHRLAPAVEDQVGEEQHQVAPAQGGEVVKGQYNGEIEEEKIRAGKNHGLSPRRIS